MEIKDNRVKTESAEGVEWSRVKGDEGRGAIRQIHPPSRYPLSHFLWCTFLLRSIFLKTVSQESDLFSLRFFQENGIEIAFDIINRIIYWRKSDALLRQWITYSHGGRQRAQNSEVPKRRRRATFRRRGGFVWVTAKIQRSFSLVPCDSHD